METLFYFLSRGERAKHMSNNLESNKIFAAILVAGITAMMSGFIAKKLVHPHDLAKDAVHLDGAAVVGSGPAKIAVPDPIMHLIATADIAKGQKLSKACAACHSFDKGGVSKVGPNLWNVVNEPKGGKSGFAYSTALVEAGGAWDYDSLNYFMWKPKKYLAGTKMNFIGLKKPADRAAIIAWLRTLADTPAGLPTDAEIAIEKAKLAPDIEEAPAPAAAEASH